ncbi:MAG TPA: hypothetical protein VH143_07115 [Kofleriaceae bacterium]|nr:hypothetical protein [Kofleriaceae bacterium]
MKLAIAALLIPALAYADPDEFAPPPNPRLALELQLFTDADWIHQPGTDFTQFRLDRGEAGAAIGFAKHYGAELRLESIRSDEAGGELGIAGDSIVVRVKRAQIYGDFDAGDFHFHAAIGITPDPWITTLETDYSLLPLSFTASERLLGWPVSDLAALGSVAYGPIRLNLAFGNGEGLDYPERNNGKTTTAVLEAVPLDLAGNRLRVMALGKDGSVGPALVRDRRLGAATTFTSKYASAGVELVRAYGIGDRGDLVGWVYAGWAEARPIDHLILAARGSGISYDAGGRYTSVGGAVAVEPWKQGPRGDLRVWLAIDRTHASGVAEPLPGAEPGDAITFFLLASVTAPFMVP